MENKKEMKVKLLDCTIRDGGYLNNWRFEKRFVREVFRSLSKAGVDYFEIGFKGTEKFFNKESFGLWRFSEEKDIAEVCSGIRGPAITVMADYGKIELADIIPKSESVVTMVRLAAHKDKIKPAMSFLAKIKAKGYETSIQAMGYSCYSEKERREFTKILENFEIDYAYVADSYGSIFPDQMEQILEPLLQLKNNVKIGFHPHNNLQMAFANTIKAIWCGVDIVDGSIFGMGRGAGNLPTEIILAYLNDKMPDKFNVIPVLNCIDKYFINMKKQIGWGYQLPYMLSGIFQCHPSYSKKLINFKEFTMEDIWRALESIKGKNFPGFSEELLDNIISQGIAGEPSYHGTAEKPDQFLKVKTEEKSFNVSYLDSHKKRAFLVLGNGPTLKQYQTEIQTFIDKYNPIVLAANYLGGLFIPHYHAFCNKRRFIDYVDTTHKSSKLLIGQYITDGIIKEYTQRDYEYIYYVDSLSNFGIVNGIIQCNCRTVSVLLMGLAVVMGAEKIFAVGMDGYLNTDSQGNLLFYNEVDEKKDRDIIIDMHKWNNKFIGQINEYLLNLGKEGIDILTPTSYTQFYKGIKNYI